MSTRTSTRRSELALAGFFSLAALWILYAFNPYAFGYGSHMVTILRFANVLWREEDWQHCYLVPAAVAGMIYFKRKTLPSVPFEKSWAGLALLVFGLFVYWIGYRANNITIGYASFQLLTGGIILWLLGWTWAKALFVPWAFLVFFYPLAFLDNLIAFPLRMIMAEASVHVLNILGIACVKNGTAILSAPDALTGLPAGVRFAVDVADPCSGIRSLFALMMVSVLYGYFTQRGIWRPLLLFLASIPLAIAGNLARILMLALGTIALGSEITIGTPGHPTLFHLLSGYLVFAIALGGMGGVAWLLNADWPRLLSRWQAALTPPPHPKTPPDRTKPDEY